MNEESPVYSGILAFYSLKQAYTQLFDDNSNNKMEFPLHLSFYESYKKIRRVSEFSNLLYRMKKNTT